MSTNEKQAGILALHEISWWKAHHRDNITALRIHLEAIHLNLYNITEKEAKPIVEHFLSAAMFHNKAEAAEDINDTESADKYWNLAELKLGEYYKLLLETLKK